MRKENLRHKIIRGLYSYLLFFLLTAFLVTCSMLLFMTVLTNSLNLTLTSENVGLAAKLTLGVAGALLLGMGMSLIMTDLSVLLGMTRVINMIVGIFAGVSGIVLTMLAYPAYQKVLKRERKKIAPEILRLTDELMK